MKPVPKEGILDMPAYVGGRDAVKGVSTQLSTPFGFQDC